MRFLATVLALALALAAAAPARALTQEELLKRRLDKMRQAEPAMRSEEQQRREQMEQATSGFVPQTQQAEEPPLPVPDPVRRPSPDPRANLWQKESSGKTATTASDAPGTPASPPAAPRAPSPTPPAAATPESRDPATLAALAAKAKAEGDTRAALAYLDQAVAAAPKNPDLYNNRGNILNNMGKSKEAVADYDRAIALDAANPAFFSNRGLAHERLGNRSRACADYKKACDLGQCDFFKSYKAEGNCR